MNTLETVQPDLDDIEFENAQRGFIGTIPDAEILDSKGRPVWSLKDYAFLDDIEPAPTVHPNLWRQARLNMHHGLFKVTERIYQVRGFDVANVSFIEGHTGVIVIDPLTVAETAAAAIALYRKHRGDRPVTALIYTHSHADHYGGARGALDEADAHARNVPIIAPRGFMWHTVSENVIAGNAMMRRGMFQSGLSLPKHVCGQVDCGIGKAIPMGTGTLIAPTMTIENEVETHVIDGVKIIFHLALESEAPSEMFMHFPELRALNTAEIGVQTMHNLCPLRGAEVRDPRQWSRYLNEALDRYAPTADVVFAQHNWPTWGNERIRTYLRQQRDLYKYLHDQTVRLMNHGLTGVEIAEVLALPESLAKTWANRGFYGTISHNVRAIVQKYLGWYDGNPSHLNLLPPELAGPRYIAYMGGAQAVLEKAQADFSRGEYRWVAEVTNHLVFADPANQAARKLCADALEQLGFAAESSTWRNAYLLGAQELRKGAPKLRRRSVSRDLVSVLPVELLLDYLAVRLDGEKAQGEEMEIEWSNPQAGECWAMRLENCAMTWLPGAARGTPDARVAFTRAGLAGLQMGAGTLAETFAELVEKGAIAVEGKLSAVLRLLDMLDDFNPMFNVVEP
ncbi:alkyl/aryl-sulfatase [Paraburkholderia unamae]|uniref:Alkyl sulfatase BDS1-like metallo-beta-lactamase superfamily hydrolase n=1 Tax=Paraburkholderia unamae TaxID=219649 RepID=A0ABX5KBH0_9BURK|nr:alkyl sulfatase dimerization domain-containing protein [Paraburkholderia unamae]PVX70868.1 alkyl sulfatase BDS1-like metallo-beta-lactamase superfamily hydrolase [Paraburkholderia unamae]